MKKFLVLFLLICSMVSAQPATPKYGQNIPPGGVLGFYPGDSKFYSLPLNASGALLVDSGEVPLWELNASGVVETLGDRAIDALSLQLSSDGTAAAPAISFGYDPDTGIYRYGAGSIGFSANGTYAGRWSAVGNFLIATTTDDLTNELQVNGSIAMVGASGLLKAKNSTDEEILAGMDDSGIYLGSGTGNAGTTNINLSTDTRAVLTRGAFRVPTRSAPLYNLAGHIYFDTDDNHFYGHNGTTWVQLDN